MFEYQKGRFVNAKKIVGFNIYQKDNTWRIAIDLDVESTKENCVYSQGFNTYDEALVFAKTIPAA